MKRFTLCTAAFLWMLAGCSVKPSPSIQQPEKEISGVYQGTAWGNNGEIRVEITLEAGSIKNIEVLDHQETKGISDLRLRLFRNRLSRHNLSR